MFTKSWEVRLPRGRPGEKLPIISDNNCDKSQFGIYFLKIESSISWSIFAKNFLISPFNIKHDRLLFLLTFQANARNRFRALCVPLSFRQEKESAMKVRSKNG